MNLPLKTPTDFATSSIKNGTLNDSFLDYWESLKVFAESGGDKQTGETVWHVIARWESMDWFHMQTFCKNEEGDSLILEGWLTKTYQLDDEFKASLTGETPYDLAQKNVDFPYLLNWWGEVRNLLEHKKLKEAFPFEEEKGHKAL